VVLVMAICILGRGAEWGKGPGGVGGVQGSWRRKNKIIFLSKKVFIGN